MGNPWFRPLGWVHRPVAWPGYVIASALASFCVLVFVAVDRHSHSVSDTLYGIAPHFVAAFLLFEWVASKRSAV
jgi:hypothetical protein